MVAVQDPSKPMTREFPFHAGPYVDEKNKPFGPRVLYKPSEDQSFAIFADLNEWVILFENGKFVEFPLAESSSAKLLFDIQKVEVANIAPGFGAFTYLLKSGKGKTFICDLKAGVVRAFSDNFIEDLSYIKIEEGIISSGRGDQRISKLRKVSEASTPATTKGRGKLDIPTASAMPPVKADNAKPAKDSDFHFKSGVQIISPEAGKKGAYVLENGKEKWITKEPAALRELSDEPAWQNKLMLLTASKGAWIINDAGTVIELPIPVEKIEPESIMVQPHPEVNFETFEHAGKSYTLLSFPYTEEKSSGQYDGETFLVREDGMWFRVAFGAMGLPDQETEKRFTVSPDGMLSLYDFPRQIDLERFDLEIKMPIAPPFVVKNGEGEVVDDPLAEALGEFPDVLTRIRNGSLKTFPFLPGEESLVDSFRIAMSRQESGSFALVGDAGSGKSQLIYSFLERIANGAYPEIPRSIRVVSLERGLLAQGIKYVGSFEAKVSLLKLLARYAPLYLFADEMHSLRGAGAVSESNVDFFEMIKTELADGSIRILGTSTEAEFYRAFAGNAAIMRRVSTIKKPEGNEEKTVEALRGWLKRFNKPELSKEILSEVYRLSERFSAVGAQPSKATKLLDDAFAGLTIEGRESSSLSISDLRKSAERLYNLPQTHFNEHDAVTRHQRLKPALDEKIIGQSVYKDALIRAYGMSVAGLNDVRRPGLRVLVAGTTGVGKTATAEAFAAAIGATYYRIEMSKFGAGGSEAIDTLRREIAGALRKDAFAVICLDEFEKADPAVSLALLSALDDGNFEVRESLDSSSQSASMTSVRIDTTKASFIATTNAGADWLADQSSATSRGAMGFRRNATEINAPFKVGTSDFQTELREQLIADGIPDTIVGRFGVVTAALPPTEQEFRQVIRLHGEALLRSVSRQGASQFVIADWNPFLDAMTAEFYKPPVQNRIVHTLLDAYVRPVVLEATLEEMHSKTKGEGHYVLKWAGQGFEAKKLSAKDCEKILLGS